jgi:heme-degrading monooxygenase HmoA
MAVDPYIAIWEFTVRPEHTSAFLAAYGPTGRWAALFRRAAGYRGTELYRDREDPSRYVTVDFWLSPEAFHAFRESFKAEYAALDQECQHLTVIERALGTFGLADPRQATI